MYKIKSVTAAEELTWMQPLIIYMYINVRRE